VLENAQFYEEGVKFNIIPFGKGGTGRISPAVFYELDLIPPETRCPCE
jgi:hypothetical protein